MSKTITFGLSVSEIEQAIKELQQYKQDIIYKCRKLAELLAEEGVPIARLNIVDHDAIYSGELLDSINASFEGTTETGATWSVGADCEWAVYVEFGTGIVGSKSPHPATSIANWKYDVNSHGEKGWLYYKNDKWHWTKGMPSRPFMYETGKQLESLVTTIAKEVFR